MNFPKNWIARILLALAIVSLLWFLGKSAWLMIRYDWKVMTFPYPVDYGEGPILDQVIRIAHFENIYKKNLESLPLTISNYPPMFQLVQVPFAWIFGPALWYGRLISILSILATAIFITLTLQTITRDWLAAFIGGMFLFAIPYILHWSAFNRVDSLALGLSWVGIFIIARWHDNRKGILFSGIFLTAAVFTRQSYGLAAPFAAFIWLLSNKPRKRAFYLAMWVAILCIFIFTLLNLLTNGGFFFNIVTANVNQFSWQTVQDYWDKIWEKMPYLIVLSGGFVIGAFWLRIKSWWLVTPYMVGGLVSALTIGKAGSNVNYLYEFSAGLSFLAGAAIAAPNKHWWLKVGLLVVLAYQTNLLYPWTNDDYFQWIIYRVEKEKTSINFLLTKIQESDGPVLADEFMGLVVMDGRQLFFQPFEFKQLSIAKVWNQQSFLEAIEKQEFGMILLYDPPSWDSQNERWTQEQLTSIKRNYIEIGRVAETLIYWRYLPAIE
jgi:hypothetical protein